MKHVTVILYLLLSLNASAQSRDTTPNAQSLDSAVDKGAMYVIDGVVSQNKLNGIDPQNILSITILKNAAKDPSMANPADKGVVIIVTKQGAIKAYQKKFSAFSKEYKEYLDKYKGDDSTCFYFIDGQSVTRDQDDFIKKLYEIPADKILSIALQHPTPIDNFAGVNVRITTKNKY